MKEMLKLIKKYKKIIIFRHTRPDVDALGSQFGLYHIIKENFPQKKVYVVGDENKYKFLGSMDSLNDEVFENALGIIVDVQVKHLTSDDRYKLCEKVIIFDHHNNSSDIESDKIICDITFGSCAELICEFARKMKLRISSQAATSLLAGMITDTNRFLYSSVNARTFNHAAYLMEKNAQLQFIYDSLYIEDLESKKLKAYFTNKFVVSQDNVAYMINNEDDMKAINKDVFSISRGMVNVMSGIEGVNIWANFTYDIENDVYLAELRSKNIVIVDIAKKYGGGGHNNACGASLKNLEEVKLMIEDLNQKSREDKQ